ncbi:MAG: hypothetical protein K8R69_08015 [Deltaproteobacteria bacterium]|nr:hypothetical protein [Deltaproteobacteria bacterium]
MSETIQNSIKIPQTQTTQGPNGEMLLKIHRDPRLGEVLQEIENQNTQSQDHFLTGLVCLKPIEQVCISRLLKLWEETPKASEPAPSAVPEQTEAAELKTLGQSFLNHSLGQNLGELLYQGLEHLFSEDPLNTPEGPQTECEVKKDPDGNISVECTVPGNFK